ncbi:MAG: MFS transporter [Actinobacteria bacterium]|nr:MFS transporter [Actinomycetota bacterium]
MAPDSNRPINTRMVLVTVALSLMTVVSAVAGLNVALPEMAVDIGASQTELTWIVDSYTVIFAGLLLLAGAIADRHGRKRILFVGLVLFALASTAGLFADSATSLIVIRMVSGLGAACIMPSTLSVITTSFPEEERAKAVGVWVGVAGGGAVIGIFGTALLLIWFPWNSFFALNLTLAILGILGTLRFVPDSHEESTAPLDWVGGLLSIIGVGALVFGIIEGADRGWTEGLTAGALVLGITGLVAFVLWELRATQPLLDPRLFTNRAFSAGSLSITIQFFAQFGFIFVGLQYLQFVAGFTPIQAALRLLPMAFIILPASRAAGAISMRVPQKYLGAGGMVSLGIGLLMMSRLGVEFNVWWFWAALAFFGFGVAFSATPATAAITSALPREKQGVASAVNDTSREFGSAVGIAVLGAALTSIYKSAVVDNVSGLGLPPQALEGLQRGVAAVSRTPPPQVAPIWDRIVLAAHEAFVSGMHVALTIAGVAALLAAVAIFVIAPRKALPTLD